MEQPSALYSKLVSQGFNPLLKYLLDIPIILDLFFFTLSPDLRLIFMSGKKIIDSTCFLFLKTEMPTPHSFIPEIKLSVPSIGSRTIKSL